MTRESALLRSLYIRTLRRFVGPRLGWRVVTPANSNCRASLPAQAGVTVSLSGHPTPVLSLNASFHDQGFTS